MRAPGNSEFRSSNPLWTREVLAVVRRPGTAVSLAVVTVCASVAVVAVGALSSSIAEPADIGWGLFQTFFSLAYLVVTWIGPAVSATMVVSDRRDGQRELVSLTSLTARNVAVGKFLAALTHLCLYLVIIAPVGALPFLFGGVTFWDVLLGYVLLLIFSGLSVALGLAISSVSRSPARSMVLTMLASTLSSAGMYLGFGLGLSMAAHYAWPEVPSAAPVWLPSAWCRVPFDARYVATLIYTPSVLALTLAWFLHELTVTNLMDTGADRSSGLRRWFWSTFPLVFGLLLVPRVWLDEKVNLWTLYASACVGICAHLGFGLLLFAGDPVTPTARQLNSARRTGTFAGNPTLEVGLRQLAAGTGLSLLLLILLFTVDTRQITDYWPHSGRLHLQVLGVVAAYGLVFTLVLVSLTRFLRERGATARRTRIGILTLALGAALVPPLVATIAGWPHLSNNPWAWLAAPSPSFAFLISERLITGVPDPALLRSALLSLVGWLALSLVLWFWRRPATTGTLGEGQAA